MAESRVSELTIARSYHDDCTTGVLVAGDHHLVTLELPWKGNKHFISCIPEGVYEWEKHVSPKHGRTIWIKDVPNRSEILIHPGNLPEDSEGCILVGREFVPNRHSIKFGSRKAWLEMLPFLAERGSIEIRGAQ